jgi:hypothetical protein
MIKLYPWECGHESQMATRMVCFHSGFADVYVLNHILSLFRDEIGCWEV